MVILVKAGPIILAILVQAGATRVCLAPLVRDELDLDAEVLREDGGGGFPLRGGLGAAQRTTRAAAGGGQG